MTDEFERPMDERAELSALPRDAIAPRALEENIVRALRSRGLLQPSARWSLRLAAVAAAALLFFGGFAIGRRTASLAQSTTGSPDASPPAQATRVVAWF